jgi:ankyrin repeat protein
MSLPPPSPPQGDDPIITQFKPVEGQWELNDENITRIDSKTGHTILHNYWKYINTTPIEVYQYLIETKGCNINVQDNNNDTPLHLALCKFNPSGGRDINVLTYLINQKNINVSIKGENGSTLLHLACQQINNLPLGIFKALIETQGFDVNAQDNSKDTPVHLALRYFDPNDGGDITVLTYLLNQGNVNVNIKGQFGNTILHYACNKINYLPLEIFKVLIETQGCDVNVQANSNNTPIYCALYCFDPCHGDMNVLTYLLNQKGVNGNIKGQFGDTLLHYACQDINSLPLEIFELLIETLGCDVNAQNTYKSTSLHYAIDSFNPNWGGNIEVLTYLLTQKDINVNIKGDYGYTLLHIACENINRCPLDVFKLLIETMGCDVNAQDNNNNTPLHHALCNFNPDSGGDINIFAYLINQTNINVNIGYKKGYTLLHTTSMINLSNKRYSVKPNAENDTISCQIVEFIAERCVQQVLDDTTS